MIPCNKCGTMKAPSLIFWRGHGQMGVSAGSACPKCTPERAVVQEEPAWWKERFQRSGGRAEEPQPS